MTSLLKYKGYLAKVEFDADEKVLRGEVLGTRDVVTFQADGAADVEREFRGSVDDYLAFCKERGERPEKPASGQFVARIDPALHRELQTLAEARGRSLNSVVALFLRREADRATAEAASATRSTKAATPRRATARQARVA